jgi:SAM-dependent methyltransferase
VDSVFAQSFQGRELMIADDGSECEATVELNNPAKSRAAPKSVVHNLLKYHQYRARLGVGDLHPGGAFATQKILWWLSELDVRRVLEVGAGIGNTATRMASLGWDVTAIEPDPVLFTRLRSCLGAAARCEQFLDHRPAAPYDAVVAESVFFQMNLAEVFAHTRAVLRPGGYLAFVEAVWTEKVDAATSRQLHETTQRLFGIAVGSREPMTWRDWSRQLTQAGFETVHAQLLPRGSAGHPPTANWPTSIAAMIRDPRLALWTVRYRARKRVVRMPSDVQESRIFLGRSPVDGVGRAT